MTRHLFSFLFMALLFFKVDVLIAQNETVKIIGKVYEESGDRPIEFATVLIADNETKKPIKGTTTLEDGSFVLETQASNFYI